MTYPDPIVSSLIIERFVPVQINTQTDAGKPTVQRYRQAWTPDIRVVGSDGFDYLYWNGYLSPAEYAAQLLVGQGMAYLREQDNSRAAGVFSEILNRFPSSYAAPEAAYFYAVARYKDSHDAVDLRGSKGWKRVQSRYPTSAWRMKQSWTEDES